MKKETYWNKTAVCYVREESFKESLVKGSSHVVDEFPYKYLLFSVYLSNMNFRSR